MVIDTFMVIVRGSFLKKPVHGICTWRGKKIQGVIWKQTI